jgi:hypothetical protein
MYARLGVVALLGLGVTFLGCGDDETTAPTTTESTATTVAVAELDSMLLDAADVGTGWQVGPAVTDADFADSTQIPCPDTAINPTIADRLTPVTGVQFEPTDGSPRHLIEFMLSGEPDRLDADLQAMFGAMDACAATTPTTTETGSLTVEPLAIPELGDQRAAYTLVGVEAPDTTWYVRDASVRVGSLAVEVGLTEILQSPDDQPSISDAEFVQLLETAVAKL